MSLDQVEQLIKTWQEGKRKVFVRLASPGFKLEMTGKIAAIDAEKFVVMSGTAGCLYFAFHAADKIRFEKCGLSQSVTIERNDGSKLFLCPTR